MRLVLEEEEGALPLETLFKVALTPRILLVGILLIDVS
jgi:hypothetical protein